jgi:hypothetical protein
MCMRICVGNIFLKKNKGFPCSLMNCVNIVHYHMHDEDI